MRDAFDRVTADPRLNNELLDRLDDDLDTHTAAALAFERGCRPPHWVDGEPVPGVVSVYPDDSDEPVLAWNTKMLAGDDQETVEDLDCDASENGVLSPRSPGEELVNGD